MLLEKSKKIREVCHKKTTAYKEIINSNKSRNNLSKVQSRKTCHGIQVTHNDFKKNTAETRNSFINSMASGNSKKKRLASGSRVKQSIVEMPKYTTRPRLECKTKKGIITVKKIM